MRPCIAFVWASPWHGSSSRCVTFCELERAYSITTSLFTLTCHLFVQLHYNQAFKPISFTCGAPPKVAATQPQKTIQPTEHRMAGVTRFAQNKAGGIPELYTAHIPVHNIALLFSKCEHNQKLSVHVDTSPGLYLLRQT